LLLFALLLDEFTVLFALGVLGFTNHFRLVGTKEIVTRSRALEKYRICTASNDQGTSEGNPNLWIHVAHYEVNKKWLGMIGSAEVREWLCKSQTSVHSTVRLRHALIVKLTTLEHRGEQRFNQKV
jgi:hypothetical protein